MAKTTGGSCSGIRCFTCRYGSISVDLSIKIINRMECKNDLTKEWSDKFYGLPEDKLRTLKEIVAKYDFSEDVINSVTDSDVAEVLKYYRIKRKALGDYLKSNDRSVLMLV